MITRNAALSLLLSLSACANAPGLKSGTPPPPSYPAHWFAAVPAEGAPSWEVLPQAAGPGEVILSKRHELGLLSNFAATPFVLRGKTYASVEGFWQAMLYPDPELAHDPRARFPGIHWPHTRAEVAAMVAFEAKAAGDAAYANMKKMKIGWVSFEGSRFDYWTQEPGEHYRLVLEAEWAKVTQNPRVREVLLSTGSLKLRADHHPEPDAPPEWRYFELWEEIRAKLGENPEATYL